MTPTPLDFAEIRRSCPKAFEKLNTWAESLLWTLSATLLHVDQYVFTVPDNPRDLFDFFDANGVYVLIERNGTAEKPFAYEIEMGEEMYWLGSYHPTRAAAEAAAFTAGFAKLEEMLGKEKER